MIPTLMTPEHVSSAFALAGIASAFLAWLIFKS